MANDTGRCPGCHFGCALDAYQCGRGREFYELAAQGEPVPERRWPMFTPSERAAGMDGKPPVNERVMRGLSIVAQALKRRHEENGEKKVVFALEHGKGFMSWPILAKRTQLDRAQLDDIVDRARNVGLLDTRAELIEPLQAQGSTRSIEVVSLTEQGRARQRDWNEERKAAAEEFLAPLSSEEREQLDALLLKLMRHQAPPADGPNR